MKLKIGIAFILASISVAAVVTACKDNSTSSTTPTADAVDYSFVVMGCNRLDKSNISGVPSTANIEQFNRSMTDIAALSPKPDYLFFAGDMVLGYSDTTALSTELSAWKALYEASPVKAAGIKLVAISGNHETQNASKVATAAAEQRWLSIMAPYIAGSNGPGAGGPDSLQTDQSKLTYSFDFKTAHFICMNTDPTGKDWHVPATWVANDVAANAGKTIFAIGHKPAYAYNYNVAPTFGTDGLNVDTVSRNKFWSAFEANKVVAMFCAHNHVYRRLRPNNKTWMVIAGNGGSPLETTADVTASDQFYGFTLVQVMKSGAIIEKSYGRGFATYNGACPAATYPTTVRDSANLKWN